MARDASGNWIPLAPVVGGTVITSTWANNMMTSFGADVTESLDRSGRGGMLVPFRIADGTKLEPGYSWTAELSTGFYRDLGGFDMRTSVGGKDIFRWNANGVQVSPDDGVTWEEVLTEGGTTDIFAVRGYGSAAFFSVDTAGGTISAPLVTPVNFALGGLRWRGHDGADWAIPSTLISSISGPAYDGAADTSAYMVFSTTAGGTAVLAERMRISEAGNVGIGEASPERKLHVFEPTAALSSLFDSGGGTLSVSQWRGFGTTGNVQLGCNLDDMVMITDDIERMRIDSSGNVGIGTTAPLRKLSIGANNFGIDYAASEIYLKQDATSTGVVGLDSIGTVKLWGDSNNNGTGAILFEVGVDEAMRITSAGNVGIGTTTPETLLDIGGSTGAGTVDCIRLATTSTVVGGGAALGYVREGNNNTVGLTFLTANGGARSEAMRIDSAGNVLMGVTSLPGGGANGWGYNKSSNRAETRHATTGVANHYAFYNGNGLVGTIQTSGSSTVYNTTSDYRLKENVVPMTGALDRVALLKPSRFNFIADVTLTVDGFIAHEAQAVVPEAVTGEKDAEEMQGIDQSKLVPLLTAAIQELTARLEVLENG